MNSKFVRLLTIALTVGFMTFSGQAVAKGPAYTMKDLNEQLVMATLWMQTSAEYRALCYQTFNLARMNLDAFLSDYKGTKPAAIIVDVDETVLDNSAYEAFLVGQDFGYSSETWNQWMAAAKAIAVPGAVEFLQYAKSKGVETFYITNRKMEGYDGTKKNMDMLNFPFVDDKHLMFRTKSSDKQERRDMVAKDYTVVLLMGDNLNDFESVFEHKSVDERFSDTDKLQAEWGKKYLVLPNPTYGEWEAADINYNWGASPAEKDQMKKDHLLKWNFQPN